MSLSSKARQLETRSKSPRDHGMRMSYSLSASRILPTSKPTQPHTHSSLERYFAQPMILHLLQAGQIFEALLQPAVLQQQCSKLSIDKFRGTVGWYPKQLAQEVYVYGSSFCMAPLPPRITHILQQCDRMGRASASNRVRFSSGHVMCISWRRPYRPKSALWAELHRCSTVQDTFMPRVA